jgi:sugar phosphate isomerase/epimerase
MLFVTLDSINWSAFMSIIGSVSNIVPASEPFLREMMVKPIALQLYSVRDAMEKDFDGTVRKVADMGYAGVETAGFPGTTPAAAAALFKSLGLSVPSAHLGLSLWDSGEALDIAGALGVKYAIVPYTPREQYTSLDNIYRICDQINAAAAKARAAGYTFAYHNHDFEYTPVEGRLPYQVMLERLDPSVTFEPDTYWIQVAGLNPADVLRELGARVPIIHIKDGPATRNDAMTALGTGKIDIPAVISAAEFAEWEVVELDRCDTDMLVAVKQSIDYLIQKGLGRGKAG